jgi:hypothetical protein
MDGKRIGLQAEAYSPGISTSKPISLMFHEAVSLYHLGKSERWQVDITGLMVR